MTVIVHSKTMKVTQALREAITRQAQRITRRFPRILQVSVILDKISRKKNDSGASQAEFLVSLPGKDVVVKKSSADLYKAIHDAAHTAILKIQKLKEKNNLRSTPS